MKRTGGLAAALSIGLAAVLTVAGCGGGGGGVPDRPAPEEPEREAGLSPDTLVVSDMLMFVGDGLPVVAQASCTGNTCSYSIEGEPAGAVSIGTARALRTDRRFGEPAGSRNGVVMETRRDSQAMAGLGTLDVEAFGGWMRYGGFAVSYGMVRGEEPAVEAILSSVSIGVGSGSNPVTGSATWSGAMAGKTLTGATVTGDATLEADFSRIDIDVLFGDIADIASGQRHADMEWKRLPMRDGGFSGDGIEGVFYGPGHEEVGGVFEKNGIVGGFAAGREDN